MVKIGRGKDTAGGGGGGGAHRACFHLWSFKWTPSSLAMTSMEDLMKMTMKIVASIKDCDRLYFHCSG